MNQEDILRMMGGQRGSRQQVTPEHVEKLDEFIDRCCKEKDETLYSLGQACHLHLQQGRVLSYVEAEVLPQVLQRIQERMNKGES